MDPNFEGKKWSYEREKRAEASTNRTKLVCCYQVIYDSTFNLFGCLVLFVACCLIPHVLYVDVWFNSMKMTLLVLDTFSSQGSY